MHLCGGGADSGIARLVDLLCLVVLFHDFSLVEDLHLLDASLSLFREVALDESIDLIFEVLLALESIPPQLAPGQ